MLLHIVRAMYLVVVLAFTVSYAFQYRVYTYRDGATYVTLYILIPAIMAFALVMVDMFWRRKKLQAMSGLFFGLAAGLVIAYAAAQIVDMVGNIFVFAPTEEVATEQRPAESKQPRPTPRQPDTQPAAAPVSPGEKPVGPRERYSPMLNAEGRPVNPVLELIKVLLGISAVFICVSFVIQTKDDFRFLIPYVEFSRHTKGVKPMLLDSSVIIDGRIADITGTRILDSELIVPRFILAELQTIADSDDKLKRNRGRRGLDILNRMQTDDKVAIRIMDSSASSVEEVPDTDGKLLALAKLLNARIMTNDYNLNKIAQLRGLEVININDLANALKPVVLPGEPLAVRIVKSGEEPGQGVGYLEDGTMVVAEQARDQVGKDIVIAVTSVLQTSAGKMIFGRLDAERTAATRGKKN
ncbi:MAG: PIN/TRAM domain-containing protein [Planctomycetes bacterium]|nr:PIN/TRAM domain-containing protein [Planctomycetota bacterium]